MIIKRLSDCRQFVGGDKTLLREIFHRNANPEFKSRYSLAHAVVPAGGRSLRHRMKTDEVYYILAGRGIMHVNDQAGEVTADDAVYIPGGAEQWIENIGDVDLCFLCIVDPAWNTLDEILLE